MFNRKPQCHPHTGSSSKTKIEIISNDGDIDISKRNPEILHLPTDKNISVSIRNHSVCNLAVGKSKQAQEVRRGNVPPGSQFTTLMISIVPEKPTDEQT